MTVSVSDMEIPKEKAEYLEEAESKVDMITKKFRRGLMTDEERHQKVIEHGTLPMIRLRQHCWQVWGNITTFI